MKKLFFTFALLVATIQVFAFNAVATFSASHRQLIQIYFDGVLLNPNASPFVRTMLTHEGLHNVTVRIFSPNGSFGTFQTSVVLQQGFESNFVASKVGRRGFQFTNTGMVALAPVVPAPLCGTPPIHHGGGYGGHHGNNGGGYDGNYGGGYQNVGNNGNNGGYGNNGNNNYNNNDYNNTPNIMTAQTLQSLQNTMRNTAFESNRLAIAQQALRGNNAFIYTQDVKTLMAMFSFENSRLAFAKFAYDYTYDRQNYFQVNDGFRFSSSINDLNSFLQSRN